LRAWARGLWCLQAAVELLIGHERWLWRDDFGDVALGWTRHVFTGQPLVTVDFAAAARALGAGVLPCSAGERQILLVAASIAEGIPVDLRQATENLDVDGVALVVRAVAGAAGQGATGDAAMGMAR
jgi:hypothetical protein